ncbi:hypothetical protein HDV06_003719 [Boothiomyces sp. JEL0866]|nr:hypothetical protein HDV06_003703 [Boothiomyces sp. JEL0866]KAJ3321982.1 hypothetical protein HDV06_003719 [Boothiomyces sp. JEL0866]
MSESDKELLSVSNEDDLESQTNSNKFSKSSTSISKSSKSSGGETKSDIGQQESTHSEEQQEQKESDVVEEKDQVQSASTTQEELKNEENIGEAAPPEKLPEEQPPPAAKEVDVIEEDDRKKKELDIEVEFQEVQYANPNVIEETFDNPIVFDEGEEVPQVAIKQNELQTKKPKSVRIEDNVIMNSRWPTSVRTTSRFSHHSEKHSSHSKRNESSLKPIPEFPVQKFNGKYTEIPHLLDGFRMLNQAPAEDPDQVFALDLSRKSLEFVIEDDMTMFTNLHTLMVGENALPFARLGLLPALRKLNFSCNGLKSLDLEVDGRFQSLEYLDLSFNNIDRAALIVLATLPKLSYLDLTSNKIKIIHPDILDMHNWRDNVIELILPLQVAAMDFDFESNAKSTEAHSEKYHFDDSQKFPTPVPNFKIESYEHSGVVTSILNSNISDHIEERTQGSLFEVPKVIGPEIIFTHADILPKSVLFLSLTDLYLTHNLIDDFDCLIGFICLRKLERIFLEANPIMKSFIPNHLLSKRRAVSAKLRIYKLKIGEDFDLYSYLESVFKIKIADACFQPPLSNITNELISVSPSRTTNVPQVQSKKGPREFLHKRINKFNSNICVPHKVEDVKFASKTQIHERTARRHYQFTDEDLEHIVQSGRIPTVKSLMEYANKQEKKKLMEPKEEIQHAIAIIESNTESSERNSTSQNDSSEQNDSIHSEELNYDPNKRDETFITGVHITGSTIRNANFEHPPPVDPEHKEEPDNFEYESESDNDNIALPTSIIATVKALRSSLRNPGIILRQSNMRKKTKPKKDLHTSDSIARLHQQKCQGKLAFDEFEEMSDLMDIVNSKMADIEKNLLSALENSKIKSYLPANKDIIHQVKQEYENLAKRDQLLIEAFYNFGGEKGSLKAIKAHIGDPSLKLKDIKERKKVLLTLLKNENENVQDQNDLASNPSNVPTKKVKKPKKHNKSEVRFEEYLDLDQAGEDSTLNKELAEQSLNEINQKDSQNEDQLQVVAEPMVENAKEVSDNTPEIAGLVTDDTKVAAVEDNFVRSKIEMLGKGPEIKKTFIELPAEMESVKNRTAIFEVSKTKKTGAYGRSRVKRIVANIENEEPPKMNIKNPITPFKFDSLLNKKAAFEHLDSQKPFSDVTMTPSRKAAVNARRVTKSKLSNVESDCESPGMSSPLRRSSRISYRFSEEAKLFGKKINFEDYREENVFSPEAESKELLVEKPVESVAVEELDNNETPGEVSSPSRYGLTLEPKKIATPRKRIATPRKRNNKINLDTPVKVEPAIISQDTAPAFSFGKFDSTNAPSDSNFNNSEGSKRKRAEDDEGDSKRFKLPSGERQIRFQRVPEANSTWLGNALYKFSKPFLFGLGN